MQHWAPKNTVTAVALRKESVDRNFQQATDITQKVHVALRKESVDRNILIIRNQCRGIFVALRKESVDRNADR